jgi:hypothetical protein
MEDDFATVAGETADETRDNGIASSTYTGLSTVGRKPSEHWPGEKMLVSRARCSVY